MYFLAKDMENSWVRYSWVYVTLILQMVADILMNGAGACENDGNL